MMSVSELIRDRCVRTADKRRRRRKRVMTWCRMEVAAVLRSLSNRKFRIFKANGFGDRANGERRVERARARTPGHLPPPPPPELWYFRPGNWYARIIYVTAGDDDRWQTTSLTDRQWRRFPKNYPIACVNQNGTKQKKPENQKTTRFENVNLQTASCTWSADGNRSRPIVTLPIVVEYKKIFINEIYNITTIIIIDFFFFPH